MPDRVHHAFSRAAATYDAHAGVQARLAGSLVARGRAEFGRNGFTPGSILELGCGTGFLTHHLRALFPAARLVATDPSAAMLARAREKPVARPVEYLRLAAEKVKLLPERFDLIASSAALQWCADLEPVIAGIADRLAPGGRFLALLFGPETYHELRNAVRAEYGPEQTIAAAGFPDRDRLKAVLGRYFGATTFAETRLTEDYASLKEFLKVIKATGTRGRGLVGKGLLTPRRLARLDAHCRGRRRQLTVTYQAFLITSRQPLPPLPHCGRGSG